MKDKPIKFYQDKFSKIIQQLKQWQAHKSKLGLKEKPRMALEYSRKAKKRLKKPLVLALVFTLIFNLNFRTKIGIK